jgi:glycosyltransferase involved in cell wall biosynthesis
VLRIGGDYAWEQGVQRFGITTTLDEYLKAGSDSLMVHMLAGVQSFVARRARSVIAPSKYLAGVVAQWGVPRESIVVAYSAPEELPRIERADARKALGIKEDTFLIASAARLVPWKGYEHLIDAVALLRRQVPSATLIIAGDGPYREVLEAHARSRGMGNAVRFAGAADCFALNTRYEGLSHQILEAFMARVPVVTTPAGGNSEIVADGASGLLAPYNDTDRIAAALRRLAEDRTLAERLREGGDEILARFSMKDSVDAIADTLKRASYGI